MSAPRKVNEAETMRRGSKKASVSYERRNIAEPHQHDVLCGRGASISNSVGNMRWRELIKERKEEYVKLHKSRRGTVADSIVHIVRHLDPPGRFLQKDPTTGLWFDIGDQKATEKTAQALREGAPSLRRKLKSSKSPPRQPRPHAVTSSFSVSPKLAPVTSQEPSTRTRLNPRKRNGGTGATAALTNELAASQSVLMDRMTSYRASGSFHAGQNEALEPRPLAPTDDSLSNLDSSLEFEPLPLEFGNLFLDSSSELSGEFMPFSSQPLQQERNVLPSGNSTPHHLPARERLQSRMMEGFLDDRSTEFSGELLPFSSQPLQQEREMLPSNNSTRQHHHPQERLQSRVGEGFLDVGSSNNLAGELMPFSSQPLQQRERNALPTSHNLAGELMPFSSQPLQQRERNVLPSHNSSTYGHHAQERLQSRLVDGFLDDREALLSHAADLLLDSDQSSHQVGDCNASFGYPKDAA